MSVIKHVIPPKRDISSVAKIYQVRAYINPMDGKKAVEATFNALFALTDVRFTLRELKPEFEPDEKARAKLKKLVAKARKQLDLLEGEL